MRSAQDRLAADTIVAAGLRFSHRSYVQETVLQEAAEATNETPTKSPASKFKAAVGVIGPGAPSLFTALTGSA